MPIRKEAAYIGLVENSNIRYDIIDRSATSENCSQIISIENVGGLLVGGASLKKHDFKAICNC